MNMMKKTSSGLNEYIIQSNHPTLKKQFLQNKSMSQVEKDFRNIESEQQKDVLDNLQGINMQLKALVKKVIHQDRTKCKEDLVKVVLERRLYLIHYDTT